MAVEIRPLGVEIDELVQVLTPIGTAFAFEPQPEHMGRFAELPEFDTRFGAFEDGSIVGAAGSFSFDMTTSGGSVGTAGLTMVAVLPTHRRRGILRDLLRRYFDAVHERGQPLSALWATEGAIYGRFGYGLGSFSGAAAIEAKRSRFAVPEARRGRTRLVDAEEALHLFPPIWEAVRPETPGMLSRSPQWWSTRRLDDVEWMRRGRGPLQRAVLELDGEPQGYALYRHENTWEEGSPVGTLHVSEAMAVSAEATRELWRYLLDVDLIETVRADLLPVDHPLLLLALEPRRLRFRLVDALWVRLVDVGAALAAREYAGNGAVVVEVADAFCPWNEGRWRVGEGEVARTDAEPDLRCDVTALGSAYLGGFTFAQLVRAGRAEEAAPGGAERGDSLFRSGRAPWCPEIF
jgi:predicted acetyltransferase